MENLGLGIAIILCFVVAPIVSEIITFFIKTK
jgi:hypothetical protein